MFALSRSLLRCLEAVFRAARVAGAVDRSRTPRSGDLAQLGIEALAFAAIRRP